MDVEGMGQEGIARDSRHITLLVVSKCCWQLLAALRRVVEMCWAVIETE